jgi:hypothetical protein
MGSPGDILVGSNLLVAHQQVAGALGQPCISREGLSSTSFTLRDEVCNAQTAGGYEEGRLCDMGSDDISPTLVLAKKRECSQDDVCR